MHRSLIIQLLAENDQVQKLYIQQGVDSLIASYKRIRKLAKELVHSKPTNKEYCLAYTILTISAKLIPHLQQYEL